MGLAQGFAGAEQGLRRDAAPVRALAPDQLSLDDGHCQPAVLKASRKCLSGDATTETHDVKFLRQLPTSVTASDGRYEECSRSAQSSIRPSYRFRHAMASNQDEGILDTIV